MVQKSEVVSPEELTAFREQPASLEALESYGSLESWLSSDQARHRSLGELELDEQERGREILRLLLEAHIANRGDGDVGEAIEVVTPTARLAYTHKRKHSRHIVTLFGPIDVERLGYSLPGRSAIYPLDKQLQLPARCYSYTIQKRLVKHCAQGPFDLAIDAVGDPTGVYVPKRTAQQILIDASADFDSFYATRQGSANKDIPLVVGSIDCKGIPMVKAELAEKTVRRGKGEKAQTKRMATVAAVYGQWPRFRTPEEVIDSLFNPNSVPQKHHPMFRPQGKRVWASLKATKDAFISEVRDEMRRRDPSGIWTHIVVTDGERALQIRVTDAMPHAVLILDLFHALDKLWNVAHALFGETSPLVEDFVRSRALSILQGNVSQVVKGLRLMVAKRNLKDPQIKTLLNVADYFYNNRSHMRYHEYLDKGFPIASGSVEGACKNLIKDRMERSGMRWTSIMAEAMIKIRALFLSDDFEPYWIHHLACDQKRLYPWALTPIQSSS